MNECMKKRHKKNFTGLREGLEHKFTHKNVVIFANYGNASECLRDVPKIDHVPAFQ